MKFIFIACLCIFIFAVSALLIAIAITELNGTDFMDAIVERIRERKGEKNDA